eukprot:727949-Pyramimonas_sp.AAC.1
MARWCHANFHTGAFGGAPYGAPKRVRGVPKFVAMLMTMTAMMMTITMVMAMTTMMMMLLMMMGGGRRNDEEETWGAVSSKRGPNTTGWLGKNTYCIWFGPSPGQVQKLLWHSQAVVLNSIPATASRRCTCCAW